jgi:hypothetical protein
MQFAVNAMPWINPSYPAARPTMVTLRVGWSPEALWVHAHVTDPSVRPDTVSTSLWNGDNIQIFFSGNSALTGPYTGTQDGGATHVIVAPAAGTFAGRAITLYESSATVSITALPAGTWASRLVADGYEIELRLPWPASAQPRTPGLAIGFNFMIGVADSASALELEGALSNITIPLSSAPQCYLRVHPGCDDRTWCTPVLE